MCKHYFYTNVNLLGRLVTSKQALAGVRRAGGPYTKSGRRPDALLIITCKDMCGAIGLEALTHYQPSGIVGLAIVLFNLLGLSS